ncbi:uncharacterized protein [Eurosta solidaginis]|uniref:uncharacterized protein n=1 Tax=Eurosta solidaginis TaxID=178769 RepID=UPI0035317582
MNFNANTYQTQTIFTPETMPSTLTNDSEKINEILEVVKKLENKLNHVSNEVEALKVITCKHTVSLKELKKVSRPAYIDVQIFPIRSLVELNSAEELIKTKSDSEVISYIKYRFD